MQRLRDKLTVEQIQRRKPVWLALSEMYLDTELNEADYRRIAAVCRDQQFLPEEIREINLWEVSRVVIGNLYSVAGEWGGFDAEWLFDVILSLPEKLPGWLHRKSVEHFTRRHLDAITGL